MEDETSEIKADESSKVHEDQNHGRAVATGFYGDSSEQEVEHLLKETTTEIGMSTENAKIECLAKPITHAFIYFNDNNERNKYVRSAKMLRKEMREEDKDITINGCRRKISPQDIGVFQMLHSHETRHTSQNTCRLMDRLW